MARIVYIICWPFLYSYKICFLDEMLEQLGMESISEKVLVEEDVIHKSSSAPMVET